MDFEERQSLRQRSVNGSVALPLTLWEVIDRFAASREWSGGKAIAHLIRQGLRRERDEANSKGGA